MRPSPVQILRISLLLFLGVFVGYVGWLLLRASDRAESGPEPPPTTTGTSEPPEPEKKEAARIEEMVFTRSQTDGEDLEIRSQETLATQDGARRLRFPQIRLPAGTRDWKFEAKAQWAELEEEPRSVRLGGDVVIRSHRGARLESQELLYDEEGAVVRCDVPVRLEQGQTWCEADRLEHSLRTRVSELSGHVHGELVDEETGDRGRFEADRLVRDQNRQSVHLRGGVRAWFGDYRMEGEELDIHMDEQGQPALAEARVGAKIRTQTGPRRDLEGEKIRFHLEGGHPVEIVALGMARASMPEAEGEPLVIRARTITFRLDAGRQPTELTAEGDREMPVAVTGLPGARGASATSWNLRVRLAPDGEASGAVFEEEVRIHRGDVEGFGRRADWSREGDLVLSGSPGIHSGRGKAYGTHVTVLASGAARVEGQVHSVLEPGEERGESLPLFQEGEGPVFVSAELLTLSPDGRHLEWTGSPVQAKQGDSSVLCEILRVDDATGRVEAEGNVRSRVRLSREASAEDAPLDLTRLVDGTSERLVYQEDVVTYSGGSELRQGADRLLGDTVRIYMEEGGKRRVRKVEAEGSAEAHLGSRHGWGDWLEYRLAEEVVVLRGDRRPARATDDSQEVAGSGKLLTLHLDSGTLEVEAHPHGRTASAFRPGGPGDPSAGGAGGEDGPDSGTQD